jgi:hypothetical protein
VRSLWADTTDPHNYLGQKLSVGPGRVISHTGAPSMAHEEKGDLLMDPFGPERYVPVILTKQGERTALSNSPSHVTRRLTPLFVVPPVEWDYDNEAPKKTQAEHVSQLPKQLLQCWGSAPAFIDLAFLDDELVGGGAHPLEWVTDQTQALGLSLTPVVSVERTEAYLDAAAAVIRRDDAGVCLRLPIDEWPVATGAAPLDGLLSRLGATAADAHLILDLAEDVGAAARSALTAELRALPYRDDWRSITVIGTAMPSGMPTGSGIHSIHRNEWMIYEHLANLSTPLERMPGFGDYGIGGVSPSADVDPKFMNISATLRYTLRDRWLIAKGGLWKGNGGKGIGAAAVPPAACLLEGDADYLGVDHCEFEEWLEPVAAGYGGGSAVVWRRYGTQHHLTVVSEQLASLHAPSTAP